MSCCRGSSISISQPWSWKYGRKRWTCTVEPRFNERLYNEVLGITNDIFRPSNSYIHEKEPRYKETLLWRTYFSNSSGALPGAHNPERLTSILRLCNGVFTSRFIFR